jgi:hypothetical protein
MPCLHLDLSISFGLDVLVLVSPREPSHAGWDKPVKGVKAMFDLTKILSKQNAIFGFIRLVWKTCLKKISNSAFLLYLVFFQI